MGENCRAFVVTRTSHDEYTGYRRHRALYLELSYNLMKSQILNTKHQVEIFFFVSITKSIIVQFLFSSVTTKWSRKTPISFPLLSLPIPSHQDGFVVLPGGISRPRWCNAQECMGRPMSVYTFARPSSAMSSLSGSGGFPWSRARGYILRL